MASLVLMGLVKSDGGTPVLCGIDLSIPDGEFCVIVGPAAAGKTALLRSIAGLDELDSGIVEIDGESVTGLQPHQRDVALVFQSNALLPATSVYKNIAFSLRARRTPRSEIELRVRRVAEVLGIASRLSAPTKLLSAADRRRAAIARAVVRNAGVTLYDEPLGDLGAEERDRLLEDIKLLRREYPTTTLYASRNSLESMALADRVVLMREGRVEQAGTPLELFERPHTRFVADFFGWPKMNFLNGTLVRGAAGDSVRVGPEGPEIKLPPNRVAKDVGEKAVLLGIRPEQMARAVRASPPDGAFRHEAEIEALRLVGSRIYATFRIGATPVTAELLVHDVTRIGERVPIDINLKRAVIFDAVTERAL